LISPQRMPPLAEHADFSYCETGLFVASHPGGEFAKAFGFRGPMAPLNVSDCGTSLVVAGIASLTTSSRPIQIVHSRDRHSADLGKGIDVGLNPSFTISRFSRNFFILPERGLGGGCFLPLQIGRQRRYGHG